jgi:hypothetical protein
MKIIEPWEIPFSKLIEEGEEAGWIHGYKCNVVISCDKVLLSDSPTILQCQCFDDNKGFWLYHASRKSHF